MDPILKLDLHFSILASLVNSTRNPTKKMKMHSLLLSKPSLNTHFSYRLMPSTECLKIMPFLQLEDFPFFHSKQSPPSRIKVSNKSIKHYYRKF